jgi:hypothetical protein
MHYPFTPITQANHTPAGNFKKPFLYINGITNEGLAIRAIAVSLYDANGFG